MIPPPWADSPGALALRDAMAGTARVLARDWSPEHRAHEGLGDRAVLAESGQRLAGLGQRRARALGRRARALGRRARALGRLARALGRLARAVGRRARAVGRLAEVFGGGSLSRTFTIRLMICIGVAGVVSEALPLQRSYWVPLTVAIVLRPDYGSVFARALQRGIGTIFGAVAGAVLLAAIHGAWLLIPFAVLAALLPYGRSRNYGLLSAFLTPLVVLLIDLLNPVGWRLAEDRLVDALIGCAIALLIGFAPWPMSWYAHLPRQFGLAALDVCRYMEETLGVRSEAEVTDPLARSRMRRSTYRALSDVRAEFQRTMSEPPSISRRAAAWWPAVVGLEQVMDAVTSTALSVSRGARVPPSGVRQLAAALRAVSEAAQMGTVLRAPGKLPDDETLKPITEAVRALFGVLGGGQPLGVRG